MVFRHGLQIWHLKAAGWALEDIRKILRHEPVQTLQHAETQDPIIGRGTRRLAKVFWVAKMFISLP